MYYITGAYKLPINREHNNYLVNDKNKMLSQNLGSNKKIFISNTAFFFRPPGFYTVEARLVYATVR